MTSDDFFSAEKKEEKTNLYRKDFIIALAKAAKNVQYFFSRRPFPEKKKQKMKKVENPCLWSTPNDTINVEILEIPKLKFLHFSTKTRSLDKS